MATITTTEDEELWDKILRHSPSYEVYKELNSDVNGNNYKSCCDIYFNSVDNNESYKLCMKIARNAVYLYDFSNTSKYSSRCSHYRYWVYENIKKIIKKTKDSDRISVAKKFINVRNCIMLTHSAYNCLFDFEPNELSKLEYKLEEKHLYDYFYNFDTIKIDETCNHVNIDKYKKYLDHISNIYKKHNNEYHCCNGSWQKNCFSYFKCNNDFHPEKILFQLKNQAIVSCNNLEKKNLHLASDTTDSSQKGEEDIMSTFYTGPCKDIGEDRLICSLRQASKKSPKIPVHRTKYMTTSENVLNEMKFPPYSRPFNITTHDGNNVNKTKSVSVGSYVLNSYIKDLVKTPFVLKQKNQSVTTVFSKTQEKPLQTVEVKEGFKWKFGEGSLSCSPNNSNEDKNNLCGYINHLKKTLNSKKNSYKGSVDLLNNIFSQAENSYNVNPIEKTKQRDINMYSSSDSITNMISNMYPPSNAVPEENVLNSNYIRISIVAALTLGIIFLFFIYYKFTPLGFYLRRTFFKKKNITSNVPNKILYPKSKKIPPTGNRKPPNRGYLVAYQSA